ncbi:MAG: PDZ domain-containing protein [bacterium]
MRRYVLAFVLPLLLAPLASLRAQTGSGDSAYRAPAGANSRSFAPTNKGFTGLSWGAPITTGPDGAPKWATYPVIRGVAPDSPAAKAGLAVGDSIVTVNDVDARTPRILDAKEGGEKFSIRVRRGGEYLDFAIVATRKATAVP